MCCVPEKQDRLARGKLICKIGRQIKWARYTKKYTGEQITQILKEAEVSNNVSDTLRKYGVNDSSYYRWKAKYGGMDSKSIQRLRELERENARLKRIVADQMLDITMLRDINSKN